MADTTIPLNAGSGGADLAVDDIAGAVYQYVGMTYGGSGSKTAVSNSNPMPVKIGDGTDYALVNGSGELTVKHADAIPVTDNGGSLTVDGTVEVTGTVDLGANSGVDIGDVDVTSVTPGTGATNLGKAEDAVHASGDVGVMALSVRTNTAISRAGTDGDYQPLITDTNGRLHVLDQNSAAALTSLQLIDDTVFTDDAAFTPGTSKGLATGYMVDSTATDSVDEGDFGVARMTADRAQIAVATERSGLSYESDIPLTVKYAAIDAASSGDNTLVASVSGKKIRVLSCFLVAAGTVTVRFESGAGGTALSGQMNLIANTGFVLPHNPHGWFQTADTTLLNLELSGAVSVDGSLTYIEAE